MKVLLCLALCGIACCAASTTCNDEEYQKCLTPEPFNPAPVLQLAPITGEDLEKYCSVAIPQIKCLYKYEESCGHGGGDMLENYKMYQRIFKLICVKKSPFRQKYLSNTRCLSKDVLPALGEKCPMDQTSPDASQTIRCKALKTTLKCSEKLAQKMCGKDGGSVFSEIYGSTFKFYAMRPAKCV